MDCVHLATEQDTLAIHLERGGLLTVFSPPQAKGFALTFGEGEKVPQSVLQKLLDGAKDLAVDLRIAELKLVGEKKAIGLVREILIHNGLRLMSYVPRSELGLQAAFYPTSGRLRVEKSRLVEKVRVLVIDDSATIRKLLTGLLNSDSRFEVAVAELPSQVESLIQSFKPHVITLDVHMPEMDGVTLLKTIIAPKYGIPTIMITSVSQEEGSIVLDALAAGAMDYIQKPTMQQMRQLAPHILEKVIAAAASQPMKSRASAEVVGRFDRASLPMDTIVAIGSSTGGTEALRVLLSQLPENFPPIVITQHIPAVFSAALAHRLSSLCQIEVREAQNGDELKPGLALIAPGGRQMRVKKRGAGFVVAISDDGPVNRHQPSVDVLFESIAKQVGEKSVGVILTGMGADGAKGLLQMKQAGARTYAQSEVTCVVFGMPKEAIEIGAVDAIVNLEKIPAALVKGLTAGKKAA